jgi:hypothetical protein
MRVSDTTKDAAPAASWLRLALRGVRHPVVWVLLLIAFFTAISGKPLDGLLMLVVASLLVWDAMRSAGREPGLAGAGPAAPDPAAAAAGPPAAAATAARSLAGRRRMVTALAVVACGAIYAAGVGAFSRYSWPATAAVIALGCLVVAIGWHGPLRIRPIRPGRSRPGALLWIAVLVAGGLWELSALLQQPSLDTTSYAHPTISALTDPVLGSHLGRSAVLAAWLLLGWWLVGR